MEDEETVACVPVPSRRLGKSLRINNIPAKTCSYSCIYCQLAKTIHMTATRQPFYNPERVLRDVTRKTDQAATRDERVDYLTFVPDGEPTLDINLGQTISPVETDWNSSSCVEVTKTSKQGLSGMQNSFFLFTVLATTWYTIDTVFCKYCPSGSLFGSIPFLMLNPSISVGQPFSIHMFTLVLTVVLALLISRFWCRYLCPMGAIAGVFNKVSLVNIDLDEGRCEECFVCLEACGMGITEVEDIGNSTGCILCGRCVEDCPEEASSFTVKG